MAMRVYHLCHRRRSDLSLDSFLSASSWWWEKWKCSSRFNPLLLLRLKQRSGALLFSWCCVFACCEWHFSGKWNDSLVRRWARVKQEDCDRTDKVSSRAKCTEEIYYNVGIWIKTWVWHAFVFCWCLFRFQLSICCKYCFTSMKPC